MIVRRKLELKESNHNAMGTSNTRKYLNISSTPVEHEMIKWLSLIFLPIIRIYDTFNKPN